MLYALLFWKNYFNITILQLQPDLGYIFIRIQKLTPSTLSSEFQKNTDTVNI